jgi:glycosyltransferase involved in cell wall biosynthesis
MKVLFLLPYPLGKAPSQRFRVESLLSVLDESGIEYSLRPFMNEATWKVLYQNGSIGQKAFGIVLGYLKRFRTIMMEAPRYDLVFIHREAAPLGPPIFEWILKQLLGKRIVFDFDDAGNRPAALFKANWKTKYICKWSEKVAAGNDFLSEFAQSSGAQKVVRIPTVVDMELKYNKVKLHTEGKVVVGWTGSHSTLKYLDMIVPVINRLQEEVDCTFLVIADKKPDLQIKDWRYLPWDANTEIEDLLQIDIGIMPLVADLWSEGKCGFKLIQYLALGIPAVASPVGVNKQIIDQGVNGFLAGTEEEWLDALRRMVSDFEFRQKAGRAGKEKMLQHYSIRAIRPSFISLFQ